MTRITAPVSGLNGQGVGGIVFADSVAHTDNEAVIDYCRTSGYTVEDEEPAAESAPKAVNDMTKDELVAHAETTAIDLGGAKTKADILAVIEAAASAADSTDDTDGNAGDPNADTDDESDTPTE